MGTLTHACHAHISLTCTPPPRRSASPVRIWSGACIPSHQRELPEPSGAPSDFTDDNDGPKTKLQQTRPIIVSAPRRRRPFAYAIDGRLFPAQCGASILTHSHADERSSHLLALTLRRRSIRNNLHDLPILRRAGRLHRASRPANHAYGSEHHGYEHASCPDADSGLAQLPGP